MNKKNSFLIVVLVILNPIMILFFQNCSKQPQTATQNISKPNSQMDTSAPSENL